MGPKDMAHAPKVILVTGACSGLGHAFCEQLHREGHRVTGTCRDPWNQPEGWRLIRLDVTDDATVQDAVAEVIGLYGRIDVLVNNAGVGIEGALEDTGTELAQKAVDTNLIGLHRMCRAVLPHMRAQGGGLIINISSMLAGFGMPYRALYSATKAAVDRYSEGLRGEVRPFGIKVVVVEPGGYLTNIRHARLRPKRTSPAYRSRYHKAMAVLAQDEERVLHPDGCARLVSRIIAMKDPAELYRSGQWSARLGLLLHTLLPARLFERLLRSRYA
jgi:NAD(P)-dependent dehydrogenase (short-subunit alcohol dehydrogenase family)